jgi:monooxygenase
VTRDPFVEHFDVLIVGAGLSGIGAAHHLQESCPGKSYAILEARDAIGGTWDLFRYPGIRSDSDMYTLGYSFRPWEDAKAIADGPAILDYVRSTAREGGIEPRIRFGHRVVSADWDGAEARWAIEAERSDGTGTARFSCSFLLVCSGYYNYDEGYLPELPGLGDFAGEVIHPQHWPEELDWAGKRVLVVGSGATAVTLVPALAETAEHVTMLQRSPGYVVTLPAEDPLAKLARRLLPLKAAYAAIRWKNVLVTTLFFQASRRRPDLIRRLVRKGVEARLPAGYDIDTHFEPRYNPWDQRVCLVPDGDLFEAISAGRASVATGEIDTFTEHGVRLASGQELNADIVVTATGLNMLALGGARFSVDGREVHLPETLAYKGMMLSSVPNMAFVIGYTNASWTLKADLSAKFACRLLRHMDEHGYRTCVARTPNGPLPTQPLVDLKAGYVLRSLHLFPRQGVEMPWRLHQNYFRDLHMLRRGRLDDGAMTFG